MSRSRIPDEAKFGYSYPAIFDFECFLKYRYQYFISIVRKEVWTKNGLRHRGNGLPAVIYADGTKIHYYKGIEQPLL